jgi:hypothetical protein
MFGLNPTRRLKTKKQRPSACSIIAIAAQEAGLHRGGEGNLRKIAERFAPIGDRIDLAEIVRN